MKNFKIFGIIATIIFLLFTSCEKDNDVFVDLNEVDTINVINTNWKYVKSERNGVEVFLIKKEFIIHDQYLTYTSYANDNGFYSFDFANKRILNISNNNLIIADSINFNNGYVNMFDSYYGNFSYKIEYISNNELQLSYTSSFDNHIKMYFEQKSITDNFQLK